MKSDDYNILALIIGLVSLAFWVGIVYIILHFVIKYW